jgi:hypothetical protein
MFKVRSLTHKLLAVLHLECLEILQPITGREPKPLPFISLPQENLNCIMILSSLIFLPSRGCKTLSTLFPYQNSIYIFISMYEVHARYTIVSVISSGNDLSARILFHLQKTVIVQRVKTFLASSGIRRPILMSTGARHWIVF